MGDTNHAAKYTAMSDSSFDALVDVIRAFEAIGVSYMVVGSFSSNFYSYPRATKDADIVVEFDESTLDLMMGQLGTEHQLDRQMSFELSTGTVRNVITYAPTGFDIELFRLSDDEYNQERFARRRSAIVPELKTEFFFPSAEDVIIQKLRWQRARDVDDAKKVLLVQFEKLDWTYLEKWCQRHDTTKLLEEMRTAAEDN